MKINNLVFDTKTFGVTQKSLKLLRDTIFERACHRIAVVEVPTSNYCSGYMILDSDKQEAIWTGDGFRIDNAGEGGRGHITAEFLFDISGIRVIRWELFSDVYDHDGLMRLAKEMVSVIPEWEFTVPIENKPYYARFFVKEAEKGL